VVELKLVRAPIPKGAVVVVFDDVDGTTKDAGTNAVLRVATKQDAKAMATADLENLMVLLCRWATSYDFL
jgi:hypothetical protein